MRLGMVGVGRMGASMVRRLLQAAHECVVYDMDANTVKAMEAEGRSARRPSSR